MSKERTYLARWDDGHDYGEFTFESTHRAKSKANLDDAKDAAWRKYGRSAKYMRIIQTQLWEVY